MKAFKLIAALFVISILTTAVSAEEKTKEYNESWPVSEVSSLEISNKFGEVRINNDGRGGIDFNVSMRNTLLINQDSDLARDPTYYTGWKSAYTYCSRYVFQYLRRNII